MQGGIETLPSSVLQEIVNGRLGAVDLAQLECCSSMFRAPSGIVPCEAKSLAEAAAHHSCQTHPMFENLPPHARSALLARCDGHWKQVLYFLECLLRMRGPSDPAGTRSNVRAGCRNGRYMPYTHCEQNRRIVQHFWTNYLSRIYRNIPPEPQSNLRLIFSQPTANRILQISMNHYHAAFVTETRQIFTFGSNRHRCCGVGLESNHEIPKHVLVTALEMSPCQQVTTGFDFTIALTRSGVLYSWGWNNYGQLGHGHIHDESRPREVIMQSDNGAVDPMVQVSTTRNHVAAVTKAGRLFTWGDGSYGYVGHNNNCNQLRPKRVEHGGFAGLFIVCASAGQYLSAAINSSGLVYTWGRGCLTPLLIDSLKAYRAVQVVAFNWTCVVLDNGQVHYFDLTIGNSYNKKQSGSYTIKGHKILSISSGYYHAIMVTVKGAVFGFGGNKSYQLGVVDRSSLSDNAVLTPTEVFAAITKSKGA